MNETGQTLVGRSDCWPVKNDEGRCSGLGEEGSLQERSLLAENFRVCDVTRAPCVTVVSSTDPTRRSRASQGDPRATQEDR